MRGQLLDGRALTGSAYEKMLGFGGAALEDERKANRDYLEQAALARSVGQAELAAVYESIAADEARHHNMIDDALLKLATKMPR